MRRIAGVDDAGRGPVIGPLVVAGVLIYESQIPALHRLNVRDSKTLTARRRYQLAEQIKTLAVNYEIALCEPSEIDRVVFKGHKLRKLNWLEAQTMARVLSKLKPDVAYVDASDVIETRFGEHIREFLSSELDIISEHHADTKYPIVSAASIIAKTCRDTIITELHQEFGDFGSGYASDRKTQAFLLKWISEHGEDFPDCVRKSWKTISKIKDKFQQTTLARHIG